MRMFEDEQQIWHLFFHPSGPELVLKIPRLFIIDQAQIDQVSSRIHELYKSYAKIFEIFLPSPLPRDYAAINGKPSPLQEETGGQVTKLQSGNLLSGNDWVASPRKDCICRKLNHP